MLGYKVPLPQGASKEAIELSKEVNQWANIEMALLFQLDDLEWLEDMVGTNPTYIALRMKKEKEHEIAENKYDLALHKMCEAI